MKIINAHVHMIELEAMINQCGDIEVSTDIDVFKHVEEVVTLLQPDTLFKQMNDAEIDKSVIYACEAPIIYSSNEYVASLCRRYPNKLIGFASVDPLQETAVKKLEYAVKSLGLCGLKFHPPLQNFYPNDVRVFSVYKKAVELNIPVVFHVGTTPFGSGIRLDQAHPLLLDEVAFNFPDLRIMLTHLGTLWHNESFMVTEKNPNVFIDTSAYLYEIKELLTEELVHRIGEDKIIFGTDYPMPFGDSAHNMNDFVQCINELPIRKTIKEKIFYSNFQALLHGRKTNTIKLSSLLAR